MIYSILSPHESCQLCESMGKKRSPTEFQLKYDQLGMITETLKRVGICDEVCFRAYKSLPSVRYVMSLDPSHRIFFVKKVFRKGGMKAEYTFLIDGRSTNGKAAVRRALRERKLSLVSNTDFIVNKNNANHAEYIRAGCEHGQVYEPREDW
jgi:hypothetical protein